MASYLAWVYKSYSFRIDDRLFNQINTAFEEGIE